MSVQFEVIFKDEGGPVTLPASDGNAQTTEFAPRPADNPPGPIEPTQGPRRPRWKGGPEPSMPADGPPAVVKKPPGSKSDGPALKDDLWKAATMAADALGAGGLASTAKGLADAFGRLWQTLRIGERHGSAPSSPLGGLDAAKAKAGTDRDSALSVKAALEKALGPGRGDSIEIPRVPKSDGSDVAAALENVLGPGRGSLLKVPKAAPTAGPAVAGAARAAPAVAGAAGPSAAGGAGGLASLAAAAGPAAIAVAATAGAVVALGMAAKKTAEFMTSEVQRLSGLSGELSVATARSDIRAELADIRRADRLGPRLARFEDTRGQIMEHLHTAVTALADSVLEAMEDNKELIQAATDSLGVLVASMNVALVNLGTIQDLLAMRFHEMPENERKMVEANKRLIKSVNRLADDAEDDDLAVDPMLDAFLGSLGYSPPALNQQAGMMANAGAMP